MGARRFEDLEAWQLANEVRMRVIVLTEKPAVAKRFKYRDQLDDASSSACRNIAEGFARFRHKEFAQFVRVARASEGEVRDLFIEARQRGFLSDLEFKEHEALVERAMKAAAGLIRYLENSPDR